MKKWTLCLLCILVLSLAGAALASAASPAAPAPSPADQQFLASLAAQAPAPSDVPQPQWLSKPPPPNCGPDFCTDAQRAACQALHPNCITVLVCNTTNCTTTCTYDPRSCWF
jgi:hypothetical protein